MSLQIVELRASILDLKIALNRKTVELRRALIAREMKCEHLFEKLLESDGHKTVSRLVCQKCEKEI